MIIYKYKMFNKLETFCELPLGADAIDIEFQDGQLTLWAVVYKSSQTFIRRNFRIMATGQPFNREDLENFEHWKTLHENDFVWHVFRERSK